MILELNDLVKAMNGMMGDYVIYTMNGKVVMRHKPTKAPSEAMLKHRAEFIEKYAKKRS